MLHQSMERGDVSELKAAIEEAEFYGIDAMLARKRYSDLTRQERQSPERVHEMMRWAMSMQDGVLLHNVIQEVSEQTPDHEELKAARKKLGEQQEEVKLRLQRLAKNRDVRSMGVALDRARQMGIKQEELVWAEQYLRGLEQSFSARSSTLARQGLATTGSGPLDARLKGVTTAPM